MADLVEVLSTPSLVEAQLAAAALRHAELQPTILGEHLAASLGAGRYIVPCRIMVPARAEAEARQILQNMEKAAEQTSGEHPDVCPECGAPWEEGFDVCWRCDGGHGGAESLGPGEEFRIQIDLESVTAEIPRPLSSGDWAILLASPVPFVIAMLAVPELVLAGVVVTGGMVAATLTRTRPAITIRIDAHALTVDDRRILWEEIAQVMVQRERISWTTTAGADGHVDVKLHEREREVLEAATKDQLARPRGERDPRAEAAVRSLLER